MAPARVVYLIVDGMGTDAFERATASGRAPALAFIKERARYVRDSVAIFPTITPAATASLLTGEVPARHGIPGMCWYDRAAGRYVNYGQSARAAVVEGARQIVRDVLHNLNCEHLSPDVSTLHEELHALGLATASVNFMVFRGPHVHRLRPNLLERLLFRRDLPRALPGPAEHYFADVLTGRRDACARLPRRGIEKRIQATDGWAACVVRDVLERESAHMILFYLHENDHRSHRDGPSSQVDNLAEADRHVAYVLDAFGSWEEALSKVGFVVTADHAQSPVGATDASIFDLDEILDGFGHVARGRGREPFEDADVACAGNGRVGFVYLHPDRRRRLRAPVVRAALACEGVDQAMWRDDGGYVVQSERGILRFERGGDVVDERGNPWSVSGTLDPVGGVVEDGVIRTPEYPLALWRIASALDLERVGDVVVTTKLTYELKDLGGADHRGGGDHGSLHAQDSLVPFLSTLDDPPLRPVTADVAPHIARHFRVVGSG